MTTFNKGGNNMIKKSLLVTGIVFMLLLSGCGTKDIVPPKVSETYPQNGAQNVDTAQTEIWVKFDETMMDKSWSWCLEDKSKYPQMTGKPFFADNNTKCILPVKLEPDKEYIIWLNTNNFKNFKDKAGNPAEPYKLTFKTR